MDIHQVGPLWGTWVPGKVIGAGSYGVVYEASQRVLDRTYTCAVKHISIPRDMNELYAVRQELHTDENEILHDYFLHLTRSLIDEYDVQKQFSGQKNFVSVYDLLSVPKKDMPGFDLFIRMELLHSIDTRFSPDISPADREREAVRLGRDICSALCELHRGHYLHRDIKPQNILVSDEGVYKLADFGNVSKIQSSASFLSLKGTLDYIAPEVLAGKKAGFSSDLYSLGLVLYTLLNGGRLPFGAASSSDGSEPAFSRFSAGQLPPPKDASRGMAEIILRACAAEPEDRFEDAEGMKSALDLLLQGEKQVSPAPCPSPQLSAEQDLPDSLKDTGRLAAQGNKWSQYFLAVQYDSNKDIQDERKAAYWYRKAAEQDMTEAQYILAGRYENGRGVEKDLSAAAHWYRKAADHGSAEAQTRLGWCYEHGEGVRKDSLSAVSWYRKAADQGNAEAQTCLADCCMKGTGMQKDLSQAFAWYGKAAEQGYARARYLLGRCYDVGWGVARDPDEATAQYRIAAEQGNTDAQKMLGDQYRLGRNVPEDPDAALHWYLMAAQQGDAEAQYHIADLYLHYRDELSVVHDPREAVDWLERSAAHGYVPAMLSLAVTFKIGYPVDKDPVRAFQWYQKAAELGDTYAMEQAASCYEAGKGVRKDLTAAAAWLLKAAEEGSGEAQYRLGVCFHRGRGVKKDLNEAAAWYRKAADSGNQDAKKALKRLKLFHRI